MVRHLERSECRREMHAHVGELPLLSNRYDTNNIETKLQTEETVGSSRLTSLHIPKRYPRGRHY